MLVHRIRRRLPRLPRLVITALALLLISSACSRGARYATGPSCEERQRQLVQVLESLPDQTLVTAPLSTPLPSATLAGSFGKGPVLEVSSATALLDGVALGGETHAARVESLKRALEGQSASSTLYVAAAATVDVRSLHAYLAVIPDAYAVRLTFARPAQELAPTDAEEGSEDGYAEQLLLEKDPQTRRAIALRGYAAYSECESVNAAAQATARAPEAQRWPELKRAMLQAVPNCACSDIDPDGLRTLLVAEQRAGNVALGSMPADFLKDTRCKASMPLRTVQQVLGDVENFEAEFSGNWQDDGVRFEEVVTNERLLNYFCSPMPGELFESISGEFATVYVQHADAPGCHPYRIEPVARGAVFGTLRAEAGSGAPGPSYHYRLGGNDLRVFGPLADASSRPTDAGPWTCDRDLKLSDSTGASIQVEAGGSLFLSERACLAAPPQGARLTTCALSPTLTPATDTPPAEAPEAPATASP